MAVPGRHGEPAVLEGVVAAVTRLAHGPEAGTPTHGRVQTVEAGSFFWHPSESVDGEALELYDRVGFEPGADDRGPRAKQVRLIARYLGPSRVFTDETRQCRTCALDFVWSAGEQENFAALDLRFPPGTCAECRRARRIESRGW